MQHGEFRDDRVVTVYDVAYPWSRDDDFFLSVLAEEPARDVLDLGCGTGRLATAMAGLGYWVTGVDPARASLDLARGKSDAVTWIEGSTEVLPAAAFDAALMTSHVAQFFVTDEAFGTALADLRRALRPGGRLIFDSRDPADRRWEKWNPVDSRRTVALPAGGWCETWSDMPSVVDGAVSGKQHYVFSDGDVRTSTATLRFRSEASLRSLLGAAGFTVDRIYGGWNRDPIGHPDGEFLVIARVPR
jgi:SAM-dependent methyltransferase